jgi:hypothetical protein
MDFAIYFTKMIQLYGENIFKYTTQDKKGLNPFYNPLLPYILIPIKKNESKVVKYFKRTIF